jgi:predicted methyltransferase
LAAAKSPLHCPRITTFGLLTLIFALPLLGCSMQSGPGPVELPDGINDKFLAEDLDVDSYVRSFEGESRGVYKERRAIVESLGIEAGDAIADIGAGTGFFSFLFAEAVEPTGTVYAVEISPGFLTHLRERAAAEAPETVQAIEGTERSVALPGASIDLAFICDVYHHFAYPTDSLASLHAAIRPGGSLVLIDFKRDPDESPEWLLEHVRAGRAVFQAEIEAAGFVLAEEIELDGLDDNYILRFDRI